MAESDETSETGDDPPESASDVQALERNAPIYVESSGGYVDIRQAQGDPTLYTPAEARDIAGEILAVADASEGDGSGTTEGEGDVPRGAGERDEKPE